MLITIEVSPELFTEIVPTTVRHAKRPMANASVSAPMASNTRRVFSLALAVKKSTIKLPPENRQYGKNAEIATAITYCVISISPGTGWPNTARPITETTVITARSISNMPPTKANQSDMRSIQRVQFKGVPGVFCLWF